MVPLAYKPTNNSKMPKSNNKNAPNIWGRSVSCGLSNYAL